MKTPEYGWKVLSYEQRSSLLTQGLMAVTAFMVTVGLVLFHHLNKVVLTATNYTIFGFYFFVHRYTLKVRGGGGGCSFLGQGGGG